MYLHKQSKERKEEKKEKREQKKEEPSLVIKLLKIKQ
jgi:hypothetical protein